MRDYVIAGTGSRELILCPEKYQAVLSHLITLLQLEKEKHGEFLRVLSGMAEGFDEALASAAAHTNIPWYAVVPNPGYVEYYWKKKSITGTDRLPVALPLLKTATQLLYVCPTHTGIKYPFPGGANLDRNEWMVDHANEVWVYNPSTKGTAQCYSYCKKTGTPTRLIPTTAQDNSTPHTHTKQATFL